MNAPWLGDETFPSEGDPMIHAAQSLLVVSTLLSIVGACIVRAGEQVEKTDRSNRPNTH